MPTAAATSTLSTLDTVRDLYRQGLYVQAYEASKERGCLVKDWTESAERVLAGRLAYNLGSGRVGRVLHLLALRGDPTNPEAIYYGATAILAGRGLLSGWEFIESQGELPHAGRAVRGDWFSLRGSVAAQMRDFDTAHTWLRRAEELAPEEPFLWIERAWVLKEEDRYEESLESARHALELRPWYRPGVQATAHLLELLGRDDEALELLSEASRHLESCSVVAQLADLHCELGQHEESRTAWSRFAELAPLLDEKGKRWLAAQRCDAAYRCGDFAEAAEWAEQADETLQKIARRIAESSNGQRTILPVGFIRQHHLTCAPATLTTLSRFWSMPTDHLELADRICYDGTPHHSQREWAEANGWTAREFTINWNNCQALIDLGIPFTLTTVDPGNAHLQAVIGYDTRRNTLIIRDPTCRHYLELLAEETLDRYASTGPRGMALVPKDKAGLLDQVDLTDAELYDHHHRLQGALEKHDRETAHAAYQALVAAQPDHLLTLLARLSLADYDADTAARLEATEALLEKFPDDANLQMTKVFCLRELSRRDERLEYLGQIFDSPKSDPLLWQQYAQELADDPREHDRAERLLRRCLRVRPQDGSLFYVLGNILWNRRERDQALQLFRFAACKEERNEHLAQVYFSASRVLERTPEALRMLESRFERFGGKSGLPGHTLFWAYSVLDRMDDAFAVLDKAMKLKPEDTDLALYAADAYARYGNLERGHELLGAVRGGSRESTWLRTAAAIEVYQGKLADALRLWREIAEREPLAIDAHHALAHLLEAVESPASARRHLEGAVRRFPHNYALHHMLIEFLAQEGPEEAEPIIRRLIEIHPVDGWARRELALNLARSRRYDEALEECEHALQLEPYNPYSHYALGWLSSLAGEGEDAHRHYRRAIELSVDCEGAIRDLIRDCRSVEERREALGFVQNELVRQALMGDGLLTFRLVAADTLAPEELLAWLRKTLEARPDVWHAWSAVIHQLLDMRRADEALEIARKATERFSLVTRLWCDLSLCYLQNRDFENEQATLEQAVRIDPNYGVALRQLASAHERQGDLDSSRNLLEQGVARMPLDPQMHGFLADVLWKLGERSAAIDHMERALVIDPGYRWGWDTLLEWSGQMNQPDIALKAARDLTERRPGEVGSWLVLAQILQGSDNVDETLKALDKAIELNPRCVDAYDARVQLLAQAGRMDEAFDACAPEAFRKSPQIRLRGRRAWLHAVAGDLPLAIKQLEEVVAEDPAFYDGWQLLAEWYDHVDDAVGYQKAVSQLVRLAPDDVVARGYLADANRRSNLRQEAKEEFRRALDLSPGYLYAGVGLFDMQMEDGEVADARRTVELLRTHVMHPEVRVMEIRLAVEERDGERLTASLDQLCRDENANARTFYQTTEILVSSGFAEEFEQGLLAAMQHTDVHPRVGALWVERFAAQRGWELSESHLEEWRSLGERAVPAIATYVELLADRREKARLEQLLQKDPSYFKKHDDTWASVGYAYVALDEPQKAARWLRDWKDRADVTPWALLNLVYALRTTGRDEEARTASHHALSLPPDPSLYGHHIWLAADAAFEGRGEEAAGHLSMATPIPEEAVYFQFIAQIVHAVIRALELQEGVLAVTSRLRVARQICPKYRSDPILRRVYRAAIQRVAAADKRWYAGLWRLFMRVFA